MRFDIPSATDAIEKPNQHLDQQETIKPSHEIVHAGIPTHQTDGVAQQSLADQSRIEELQQFFQRPKESSSFGLSSQERKFSQETLITLKKLIESRKLTSEARDFLLSTEVSTVIAGVRPAAYVQPKLSLKGWRVWEKKVGINQRDIASVTEVLRELGVTVVRDLQSEDVYNGHESRRNQNALLYIQRDDLVIQRMRFSGMFSDDEIDSFQKNPRDFYGNTLNGKRAGYASAFRIGVLLGYPMPDVAATVELQRLKEKKGNLDVDEKKRMQQLGNLFQSAQTVKGLSGVAIGWNTMNPHSVEVTDFQHRIEDAVRITREVFGEK